MMFPAAIAAIADDSDRAFMEKLYTDYHMLMYRTARAALGTDSDADDAVNDACIALIKKISLLRTLECNVLRRYVVSSIERVSINLIRKRGRDSAHWFSAAEETLAEAPSAAPGPEERAADADALAGVCRAILHLPEQERKIMQMRYFDALSDPEIAAACGIKPDGVRVYLMRARQRLKKWLEEQADED